MLDITNSTWHKNDLGQIYPFSFVPKSNTLSADSSEKTSIFPVNLFFPAKQRNPCASGIINSVAHVRR